ncbi:Malonyl-[acyl-carrier protein] O-methyltransferase [BD1-7 clade bacterium]|uniref:Malonyl-[acyl-carrier protein] O-methyltransferase n=1 Tax=BD1-7 clade bacterium TaxID=2029982 RepID=A0A5S9Q7K1_9GAMM|nr:Malonyl-[acyl-carrier protein] O-methyltransferase [BD1-7 clade bacterium]
MSWQLTHYNKEYAINHDARVPCVLIPGWSVDNDIFEWLMPALAQDFKLYTADVGCYSDYADVKALVDGLVQTLADELEHPAWIVGWSMGGNIALDLALRYPQQVEGLGLIATGLSFVQRDSWPAGMPQATFEQFSASLGKNVKRTLQRFDRLQAKGDDEEQSLTQSLAGYRQQQTLANQQDLQHGLALLGSFDHVEDASQLTVPTLFCFGSDDALVSVDAAEHTATLLPRAHVHVFEGAAHLPFLTCTDVFFDAFDALLEANQQQHTKRKVAKSFSRAAPSYDQASAVQQWVARALLDKLPLDVGARCVDAGCGTGIWTNALAARFDHVIGLDMAEGMLEYGRTHHSQVNGWLCADVEQLPLADASADVFFSSLAVQWCHSLEPMLHEWYRALKPGGYACLATLGPKTLFELRESFSHADEYQHVNRFIPADKVCEQVNRTGFDIELCQVEHKVMRYDTMRGLLRDLKDIGAHTVVEGGVSGLMGRQRFRKAESAYQGFKDASGLLPATYEVIYLVLKK